MNFFSIFKRMKIDINKIFKKIKLQRENIVTKIRLFKSLPERGLTIETYIEKTSLEADENGKEILLVIKSLEIRNEKVFYTDLNGLIPKKRTIKSYNSNDFASFSNNFYPVTAFSYIEDDKSKIRMTFE